MYTEKDIEAGIGCYADRQTAIFTNEDGEFETAEHYSECPTDFWLCGFRQENGNVDWF